MGSLVSFSDIFLEKLQSTGKTKRDLAKKLGTSEGTLASLFEDSWTVVDRRLLERLLDELGLKPNQVFSANQSTFFDRIAAIEPYKGAPRCHLVIPPIELYEQPRDHEAIEMVENFLRDKVPNIALTTNPASNGAALDEFLSDGTCILFGAPRSNRLAEIALCQAFGIEGTGVRDRLAPFWFVDPREPLYASPFSKAGPVVGFAERFGVYSTLRSHLAAADMHDPKDYHGLALKGAVDAGIVVVHHNTSASGKPRKLVLLAGISRIGTLGAANALVADFRDLEPEPNESTVWGIVETRFNKDRGATKREYRGFRWIMREGGRSPVSGPTARKGTGHAGGPPPESPELPGANEG